VCGGGCGFAGGVVVVAEVLSAQAGAAAAVAVGEDVAALVAFGCFGFCLDGVVHWSLPTGYFLVQSLRNKRVESGLPSSDFSRLKTKARLLAGPFLFFCLLLILSNGEKLNSSFGGFIFWLPGV
jgi:hypothetical protein